MNKKEKALFIQQMLEELFPNPPIPLHHSSPFTLLIAVLLSAQCTDQRVNQVTPALFALADTPELMQKLKVEDIEAVIHSCGLAPQKAKAIQALSCLLVEQHGGQVPDSFPLLEALPGVGHKTASVVMVQAFKKAAFPVDTHIHRLAGRWGLSQGKTVTDTEKDLKRLFPRNSWGTVHLQMIYYARTYCPARGHRREKCPICSHIS